MNTIFAVLVQLLGQLMCNPEAAIFPPAWILDPEGVVAAIKYIIDDLFDQLRATRKELDRVVKDKHIREQDWKVTKSENRQLREALKLSQSDAQFLQNELYGIKASYASLQETSLKMVPKHTVRIYTNYKTSLLGRSKVEHYMEVDGKRFYPDADKDAWLVLQELLVALDVWVIPVSTQS